MAAGVAPARVVFTSGFSARYTGGVREFEIEAKNLRGVIKVMDAKFPDWARRWKTRPRSRSTGSCTRSISGAGEAWRRVFFIPKIEGG